MRVGLRFSGGGILTNRNNKIISVILLLVVSAIIFLYTVKIRESWFGTLSEGHHQWLSANTLKFSKDWYAEGAIRLKFLMLRNPRSIEFPTMLSRLPHYSYPPGCVVPIYAISKLRGHEPTTSLLMKYNLANHFLIAYLLSLTVFFFLNRLEFAYRSSFVLALIPLLPEFLLPAPLYWHQNVFFADQAIILPFVLFIFLEVIRGGIRNKFGAGITNFFQSVVMFYGILTDWFFIIIAVTVYVKRILNGEVEKSLPAFLKLSAKYWSAGVLALILYLSQLYYSSRLGSMIHKLLFRTGLSRRGEKYFANFYDQFWSGHVGEGYGETGVLLLWGSLIVFVASLIYTGIRRFRREPTPEEIKETISLIGLLLIPCFLQVYFFKNHSAIHDFSALKMSVPLAAVPFVLVPVLFYLLVRMWSGSDLMETHGQARGFLRRRIKSSKTPGAWNNLFLILSFCLLLLAGLYVGREHPRFKDFFPGPDESLERVGRFIAANTRHDDVVFTPDYENIVPAVPPQRLCHSMKRVYKINSILHGYEKVKGIDGRYEISILLQNGNRGRLDDSIDELISAAYDVRQAGEFSLYKIKMKKFLQIWEDRKKGFKPNVDHTDFNGDGVSDIAVFRESSGRWSVRGITRFYFGSAPDRPLPGDYDGDGLSDFGIFREEEGLWAIRGCTRYYFGSPPAKPVPGDYNGDGSFDIGVFKDEAGLWAIRGITRFYFGSSVDTPVPGDYNGDGTWTAGLFREGSGLWILRDISRYYFGCSGDLAVPGDYDGDGTWEAGVFRPNYGLWAIRGLTRSNFGDSSSKPVPADYDGDSVVEMGIFNRSTGLWAIRGLFRCYYGHYDDLPVTR